MQYFSPLKSNEDNSVKHKIAIVLVIISSIGYFALFTGLLGFLKTFLLGLFGLSAYPLFFCGYAISFMLFKNKTFVFGKKFIIFLLLAIFSILSIFHLAFSSFIPTSSYGAYLSGLYLHQTTVGGLVLGLITYPLIALLQYFGAYIVFVVLLVISAYKILDYFLVNKKGGQFFNKKQKTRIEEVKFSRCATQFLNEQIFENNEKENTKITLDAELEKEESKRDEAINKLGLKNEINAKIPGTNKQLSTFERIYTQKETKPIFSNESSEDIEENLNHFNAFNYSSYTDTKKEINKEKKQQNLDFLRATLDAGYHKQTTEDIAQMKKRNLNLEDNLKNLPINEFLDNKNTENQGEEYIENKENKNTQSFGENQSKDVENNETKNIENEKQTSGEKISDVKIDDLINKVKKMESENPKPENIKKYSQTDLFEKKGEPKMAKYKKPTRYVCPPTNLLNSISTDTSKYCEDFPEKAEIIERTLENFKIPAHVIGVTCGPSVTRFELEMPPGISVNKITQYSSDIEMALASSHEVRIEAPIPGKSAVGIEVPNDKIATVGLRDILESREFRESKDKLVFALGKDIGGKCQVCNISSMPHLLVAGTTGSGKSVCLNVLLISLLYKCSPEDLRLILVDPKRVEFSLFNNLPHMLIPEVIYNSEKTINALNYLIKEMERRYSLFGELYVKKIDEYNETEDVCSGKREKLPYIVMIIDEVNDLMSSNKKEIEDGVVRISQKARAAGIHLILATQRPSVDVITGIIKANFPSRIAFAVKSGVDSKTILDRVGAEKLLGKGDMLYSPQQLPEPVRIQCAFVSTEEMKSVVNFVKQNNECVFSEEAEREINKSNSNNSSYGTNGCNPNEVDSLLPEALRFAIELGQISISGLQRRFGIGFSRAGRIIDQMQKLQYVSPSDGSKARTVYLTMDEYRELYGD